MKDRRWWMMFRLVGSDNALLTMKQVWHDTRRTLVRRIGSGEIAQQLAGVSKYNWGSQ
jgi:hypothetical protein